MTTPVARILLEGLEFPECPRWHEGSLWFSDMDASRVIALDMNGTSRPIAEVPGNPGGLGWSQDGRLLVVSMSERRLFRLDAGGLTAVADLSKMAPLMCNDMVVDRHGRAYIGHFGVRAAAAPSPFGPADIIMVGPDGAASVAAGSLSFPNGMCITPDGDTLIVAESFGHRLTAFAVEPDGSLTRRRVWADLPDGVPDGICLDAEGAVWAGVCTGQIIRVLEGGRITHKIGVSTRAIACARGGPQRRTLFITTAIGTNPAERRGKHSGRIEVAEVEVPGAGLP
jgi:sugar lactone lactonase YvrE